MTGILFLDLLILMMVSALMGFLIARRMYGRKSALKSGVLMAEVNRLQRRSRKDDQRLVNEMRDHERLHRQVRQSKYAAR
jgi:hypothetical protein